MHFKPLQMKTIWNLVTACLKPIMYYAGETGNPMKREIKT